MEYDTVRVEQDSGAMAMEAWRDGNKHDASDGYVDVVAGINLARLIHVINLALISLG